MAEYPEFCLRGLRKQDHVTPEGISGLAFAPDPRTAESRPDRGLETSVNWEDDERVVEFTLHERSDTGSPAYPFGIARLPRQQMDRLNGQPGSRNALSYERAALPGNPYHGNIVFRAGLSKPTLRMIAGALALSATHVPAP
jgi:hypothetical protein